MQWLPYQDWREAAFTFNWWQMQPSCQRFIRATCKLLIPTSFISLMHTMISKNQTSLHLKLFLCCSSDDSAQFIESDIVAYKQQCHRLSVTLLKKTTSKSIFKRYCSSENPYSIIQEIVTMPSVASISTMHPYGMMDGWMDGDGICLMHPNP